MADEEAPRRINRGRQKVAMVKMENESNLQVTFSKRRSGLFKKASELCTLCGANVALVVFSPGKKAFSFGHPSVEAVLNRLARGAHLALPLVPPAAAQLMEAHRSATLRELNWRLTQVLALADQERKRGEAWARQRRASVAGGRWWASPVDHIDGEDRLLGLLKALRELKAAVTLRTDRLVSVAPFCNGNADIDGDGFGSSESSSGTISNNDINIVSYGRAGAEGFY